MIFALIGHRGVGKTTLLKRIATYYRDAGRAVTTVDLDREIAQRACTSIAEIFSNHGEAHFRAIEQSTLCEIVSALRHDEVATDAYIAVGAGYLGTLPDGVHVVWIRRATDERGRIFLDSERPRLSPNTSPLAEYLDRFAQRQNHYRDQHHDAWFMPEGLDGNSPESGHPAYAAERAFVLSALATSPVAPPLRIGGVISILAEQLRAPRSGWSFADWLARRLSWRDLRFELRDDLFADHELTQLQNLVPPARRIFSFRRTQRDRESFQQLTTREPLWDFPLELAHEHAPHAPPILSLHERQPDETFGTAANRLAQAGARLSAGCLKLAVEVRDFTELLDGWRWAQVDPTHRAFLPRAPAECPGRWRWFRLLTAVDSPLAFFRESDGTSLDQPHLAAWWQRAAIGGTGRFAAVLGEPIEHSRTPIEHASFFAQHDTPILAIRMSAAELRQGGLDALRQLGLRYAAVTAPLKRDVARLLRRQPEIDAVNTLYYSEADSRWHAANTDLLGARALLAPLQAEAAVAIWGGGGTLSVLRAVLPQARCFSARTGQPRDPLPDAAWRPAALVWAGGNQGAPDANWTPRAVYDLSYGEDSAGREYALRCGARYVSGLAMFFAQAAAQRDFFSACEAPFQEKKS